MPACTLNCGLHAPPCAPPQIAAACCRLSTAWQWAQQPPAFAAALQQGLPSVAAQLEDAAAVQAVLSCVEPAVPATAYQEPSAAAAAEQFLAAVAAQPVQPTVASEFATAAVHAVPTPARPVPLAAPLSAAPVAALGGAAAAAAAAAGGSSGWESAGGSGQWEAPLEQYQRIVTIVPDDMDQQRQKRGWEERGSSPAKRSRSEAAPPPHRPADRLLNSSLSDLKRRRIEEDVPPGSSREALLVKAVERSCGPGQERQGGELGNALRSLDRWGGGLLGSCMVLHWLCCTCTVQGLLLILSQARPMLAIVFVSVSSAPGDAQHLHSPAVPCSNWKERLGGHSITDLLLAMSERGLVRAQTRKDPNSTGSGCNVFYSRAVARPPPPAVRPQDPRPPPRPPPAAKQAGGQWLAQDVPPGSRREALLVKAVAELDSRKIERGQLLSPANLGEILNSRDR